jgi:hypothetical protein
VPVTILVSTRKMTIARYVGDGEATCKGAVVAEYMAARVA